MLVENILILKLKEKRKPHRAETILKHKTDPCAMLHCFSSTGKSKGKTP